MYNISIKLNSLSKTLIFINIVALFVLPQINNIHYDPSPTFWGQITFAGLSIIFFIIILITQKKITFPFVTIPITLFAIYLCTQQFFVPLTFVGLNYITAIEFLICIFLAITVNTIIINYNLHTFMVYLCVGLIIGAIFQTLIGFIQYNDLFKYFGGIIFYDPTHPTTNIFGHFGQRNQYCHFVSWAIFALIYLYHSKIINKYIFFTLLCWFMFSVTIAGSRSVFIYFGMGNLITFIYFIIRRDKTSRHLLFLTIISSISLFAFEYLYPLIISKLHTSHQIASGLNRLDREGSETDRRMIEWQKAYITFKEHVIFGIGFYGYAKNSVFLYKLFPNTPLNDGLFINCHNLILQLLSETGIIGTAIVVIGIAYAIKRMSISASAETIILRCMISTTIAHSMLEYPLWYLYFLGPFIMFLSIDRPIIILSKKTAIKLYCIPIIVLILIIIKNSLIFNNLVDYIDTPENFDTFKFQATKLKSIVDKNILASYLAILTLDNYINIDTPYTNQSFTPEEQLKYESMLTNFQPYPNNLIKLAKLEWNIDNKDKAKELTSIAITAFPVYKTGLANSLHSRKYKDLYNIINLFKK